MLNLEDTYRHKGMRKGLIRELALMGINDQLVLNAIDRIPRHWFLSSAFLEFAYQNKAFQIGAGQTISQPFTVAFQTQLLKLKRGDKVLEIGTGSGFQTCVLCELGAKVWSIERQRLLHNNASDIIHALNYAPKLRFGDGFKGIPHAAPFDKVIITCGAPYIPEALLHQLKIGGKMIIPVGEGDKQQMIEIDKISEHEFSRKFHGDFSFVPMLESKQIKGE